MELWYHEFVMTALPLPEVIQGGRSRQKLRTRNALLAAARELIAAGASPTVDDAAGAAGISRTTAYRYFRSQGELLAAAHPWVDKASLLPAGAPASPGARLDAVVAEIHRMVLEIEPQLRTLLRLSLAPGADREALVLRKGRAITWIDDALAPLRGRLPEKQRRRLILAVRASVGIEALVWLTDVAGVSRREATAIMRWSAMALLRSALAEAKRR